MSDVRITNILTTDLTVITAEINSYKHVAGHAIFEIGRRLKHVKENDLTHGQFGKWVHENFRFTPSQASNLIAISEQFGELPTSASLSAGKLFELIALPVEVERQEFLEQKHTVPSTGEQKSVEDMTVRELREVKKALKDAEARERKVIEEQALLRDKLAYQKDLAAGLEREKHTLESKVAELASQPPQQVEVVPEDIVRELEVLRKKSDMLDKTSAEYEEMAAQIDMLEHDREAWATSNKERLAGETSRFHTLVTEFLRDASVYSYLSRHASDLSDYTKAGYISAIRALDEFVSDMKANFDLSNEVVIIEHPTIKRVAEARGHRPKK